MKAGRSARFTAQWAAEDPLGRLRSPNMSGWENLRRMLIWKSGGLRATLTKASRTLLRISFLKSRNLPRTTPNWNASRFPWEGLIETPECPRNRPYSSRAVPGARAIRNDGGETGLNEFRQKQHRDSRGDIVGRRS